MTVFQRPASGTVYLIHRRMHVEQIELFADKPRILIPGTPSNALGQIVFGPVYYENDFALVMARAYGSTDSELIGGARLRLFVNPARFQGTLGYQDPLPDGFVPLVTGADGAASILYQPPDIYGYYLPADSQYYQGASLLLPEPVSISRLWIPSIGWAVRPYLVRNDNPYLGKVGADLSIGEIPWTTNGTPGTPQYRTNGMRVPLKDGAKEVVPVQVYDAANRPAFLNNGNPNPAFSGNAVRIEFAYKNPDDGAFSFAGLDYSNIGAFFIGLIGQIELYAVDEDSGVRSNTIVLQLDVPPLVSDDVEIAGYLYLDENGQNLLSGRLNVNRLGGGALPKFILSTPRY